MKTLPETSKKKVDKVGVPSMFGAFPHVLQQIDDNTDRPRFV
jgi:hypothetical protein